MSLRVAVIGVGVMGNTYAQALAEGTIKDAILAALSSPSVNSVAGFEGVPRFSDWNECIQSNLFDAVVLATPQSSHCEIGAAALRAGLHLLVEKPLAPTSQKALELVRQTTAPGQVFGVVLNQRLDPLFQHLKNLVESGEVGAVTRVAWTITDWFRPDCYFQVRPWRGTWAGASGGVLINHCLHNLDIFQWIFGMPDRVVARCAFGRYHQIETEDEATSILSFKHGMTATLTTSTGEAPGVNRLEVATDRGLITIENRHLTWKKTDCSVTEFCRTSDNPFGRPSVSLVAQEFSSSGPQQLGILQNFCDAITSGAALVAPGAEGVNSVILANALLASSITNSVVLFPFDHAHYAALLAQLSTTE